MTDNVRKRFIAGAICPACGAVDKIFVLEKAGERSRHCSRCDFSETLPASRSDSEWESINLMAPPKGSTD